VRGKRQRQNVSLRNTKKGVLRIRKIRTCTHHGLPTTPIMRAFVVARSTERATSERWSTHSPLACASSSGRRLSIVLAFLQEGVEGAFSALVWFTCLARAPAVLPRPSHVLWSVVWAWEVARRRAKLCPGQVRNGTCHRECRSCCRGRCSLGLPWQVGVVGAHGLWWGWEGGGH